MNKVLLVLLMIALLACGKKKGSNTWVETNTDGTPTTDEPKKTGEKPEDLVIDGRIITCGSAGKGCYEDSIAIGAREATTPSGKKIVFGKNSLGVDLWTEKDGKKILKADGSDQWQLRLNPDGKNYSGITFENRDRIAGRVCPPNVYMNDADKFSLNRCLYYDAADGDAITLNASGTSQQDLGSIGLGPWNATDATPRWYVGNVETCAKEGMRLSTAFEAALPTPADFSATNYPTADGTPIFGNGKGVPNTNAQGYFNWTATSDRNHADYYVVWRNAQIADQSYAYTHKVRCVIP